MTLDALTTRITAAAYHDYPETSIPTELIDGEIVVAASPKNKHQQIVAQVYDMLKIITGGRGTLRFAPMDVFLDEWNVFQPDVFWVSGEDSRCKLGPDDYWYGAPDLVCEVLSPGTARKDRDQKFTTYARCGVRELWLIDPLNAYLEVFSGQAEGFVRLGVYEPGDTFTSPCLGQAVAAQAIFAG
ncbi:MAG: Uma2 family endonuclease [Anaerolineae bacterium]|nr:Uma2 family endonuclease [Anaerolineae bacterium]